MTKTVKKQPPLRVLTPLFLKGVHGILEIFLSRYQTIHGHSIERSMTVAPPHFKLSYTSRRIEDSLVACDLLIL